MPEDEGGAGGEEQLALELQPSEEVMWVPETYRCLMTRISGHQKSPFDTLPQLCEQIHRGYPYHQERSGGPASYDF